jgi:hypothetical protein
MNTNQMKKEGKLILGEEVYQIVGRSTNVTVA